MPWIKIIDLPAAKGRLKKLYDQIKTPEGHIDNI
ncbi:MAG: alkylhydroperoxidase, partial [Gammaproteobacteria bacterium]|nr:alkylhydroperoxidase [Gammaproteobacteria bacterium]